MFSFSCCQGSNFSLSKLICCMRRKKQDDEEKFIKISRVKTQIYENETVFKIEPLTNINKEKLFDFPEDIIMSVIINNKNQIISLSNNNIQQVNIEDNNLEKLSEYLPKKMAILLRTLHYKAIEKNDIVGCKLKHENYQYSIVGIPVLIDGKNLSTVILKKIHLLDESDILSEDEIIKNL